MQIEFSTKKYPTQTRNAISKVIKQEWAKNKDKMDSAEEFGEHVRAVLREQGFKAAGGMALTPRGVRFQVFQAGIRFNRGIRKGTKIGPRAVPPKQARRAAAYEEKAPANFSVLDEVKRVLNNQALTEEQRLKLISVYVEL